MKFRGALVSFLVLAVTAATPALAGAAPSDTVGQTSLSQRIVPAAPGSFRFLQLGAGEPYTVRQDLAIAGPSRDQERTSLVYFGQLSASPSGPPGGPGRRSRRKPARR